MATIFALNEGTIDRTLRVLLGVALLSLTFLGPKTLWGLLGLVPFVTGLAGTCPLYSIVGIRTCPTPTNATSN
jgi:DUF2892 family protein